MAWGGAIIRIGLEQTTGAKMWPLFKLSLDHYRSQARYGTHQLRDPKWGT